MRTTLPVAIGSDVVGQGGNLPPIINRPTNESSEPSVRRLPIGGRIPTCPTRILLLCFIFQNMHAETNLERGKRIVNECLDALGGDRYLHVENREQSGRAYSFYREQLTGLSIAKIYTRYNNNVTDTAHELAQRERQNFGKKEDYGNLFDEKEAWDLTFRGAR